MQPDIKSVIEKLDTPSSLDVNKPASIWEAMRSIHSTPILREWASLESVPLQPWLTPLAGTGRTAIVATFLSCPKAKATMQMPWALIAWHLPSFELICLLKTNQLFQGLSSPFSESHLATMEYCNDLEMAFSEGRDLPVPTQPLDRLYREFLLRCPWGTDASVGLPSRADESETQDSAVPEPVSSTAAENIDSARVMELAHSARELVTALHQEKLLEEWRHIYSLLSRAAFTFAVTGEFSRGKSTLVNNLIGQEIVPVGDLPTTAMLTRIRFGSEPRLLYIRGDGSRESFPIEAATWEKLANEQEKHANGVVDLTYPHSWLKEDGIEIIDTPGVNALFGPRAAAVSEAIGNCEGTLVVVSATMAMSLTERGFIEEHVLSKKIPRIAIVLTRLDQVEPEDRLRVINFTAAKVLEWAPLAELWLANDSSVVPGGHAITVVGKEQIMKRISEWAVASDRVQLQYRQVLSRLSSLLKTVRDFLQREKQTRKMSVESKKEALRRSEEALRRRALDWEDFRIETRQRELVNQRWMEDVLLRGKPGLIENLIYQAEGSSDLKSWWNERLPFLLRRELAGFGRQFNQELTRRLDSDGSALAQKVAERFERLLMAERPEGLVSAMPEGGADASGENAKLQDLSKTHRLIQVGFAALSAASLFIPGGAVVRAAAMMGSAVSGTLFSKMMGSRINDQKAILRTALDQVIDAIFTQTLSELKPRVAAYYTRIIQDMHAQETLWYDMQMKALMGEAPVAETGTAVDSQLRDVEALLSKTAC